MPGVTVQPKINLSANTNRGPSAAIWADCPVSDIYEDPSKGMHFFDDFLVVGNADDALAALAAASPRVQSFRATCEAKPLWAPYAFLNLCIEGVRQQDVACVRFCEHVTAAEVRLLVEACCARLQIAV